MCFNHQNEKEKTTTTKLKKKKKRLKRHLQRLRISTYKTRYTFVCISLIADSDVKKRKLTVIAGIFTKLHRKNTFTLGHFTVYSTSI